MTTAELDIISRMRGEVYGHRVPTGENLFLVWGYPTAFFLLIEFAALMLWKEKSCVSVPRRCAASSARRSQLLITALVTVITLIIPGHMFNKYVKNVV